ncbi:MAG: hypothetical protein ABI551_03245 [Polyangiaceae bacterium]
MDELRALLRLQTEATDRMNAVREQLRGAVAAGRELAILEQKLEATRNSSPYRVADARAIEAALARARAARGERERLRIEEASLLRALEDLRSALEGNGYKKFSLPLLETVEIASPCPANWADMQGDADVRFCTECMKDVFNLSMMSREEAEATLVASKSASMCIRFYRRSDGTVLTQDCPVGVRRRRFWRRTGGIAAAGLLAAALGMSFQQFAQKCGTATESTSGLAPR